MSGTSRVKPSGSGSELSDFATPLLLSFFDLEHTQIVLFNNLVFFFRNFSETKDDYMDAGFIAINYYYCYYY